MSGKTELGRLSDGLVISFGPEQQEKALKLINLHHYGEEEVPLEYMGCTEEHKAAADRICSSIALDFEIVIFSDGSKQWRVKKHHEEEA